MAIFPPQPALQFSLPTLYTPQHFEIIAKQRFVNKGGSGCVFGSDSTMSESVNGILVRASSRYDIPCYIFVT